MKQCRAQLAGLVPHHLTDSPEQKLFLKGQQHLLGLPVLHCFIDQTIIDPGSELLSIVSVADHLRFHQKDLVHNLGDGPLHRVKLSLLQKIHPHTALPAGNGLVLHGGMSDQPSGTDSQEMVNSFRRIICLLQLPFQGRKGLLPKSLMDTAVLLQPTVINGGHIELFICKMFQCMLLE